MPQLPVWLTRWLFSVIHLFKGPVRCWHAEFPYRRLRRYLIARRMPRLARMVPWSETEPLNRTKHYINEIKSRILVEGPEAYGTIARNESHIRMVSSLWHACRYGFKLFLFSLLAVPVAVLADQPVPSLAWWAAPVGGAFVLAWLTGRIEGFIHYQRVHEIMAILSIAASLGERPRTPEEQRWYGSQKEPQQTARLLVADLEDLEAKGQLPEGVPQWLREMAKDPEAQQAASTPTDEPGDSP